MILRDLILSMYWRRFENKNLNLIWIPIKINFVIASRDEILTIYWLNIIFILPALAN